MEDDAGQDKISEIFADNFVLYTDLRHIENDLRKLYSMSTFGK